MDHRFHGCYASDVHSSIQPSNKWFLSPHHVPGTMSKTGNDTCASLMS